MPASNELLQYQLRSGAVPAEESEALLLAGGFCHPRVAHFGNAVAEYKAAQETCAVFDVSDRVQIEISGKDARNFLHSFCTNDIKRLAPGDGCEAFITNAKGRILAHIFAFATEDAVWIESPPTDEETLLAHFDRYLFSKNVRLAGHTEAFGELLITGRESVDRLSPLGIQLGSLDAMQHATFSIEGTAIAVRRVDPWGGPGFLLSTHRQGLVELWQRLVAAGVRSAGAQVFHALRIEAALPIHGIDLSSDNLAQEAGRTEQAISFTKGCYLGQEPIARIDALGHINRQVCRLRLETDAGPSATASVVASDGSDVGAVTSSMVVPGEMRTVALAMLRSNHAQPGTAVTVQCGEERIAAVVF